VRDSTFCESSTREKLALIVQDVAHIHIEDDDTSLFDSQYDLSAELMVYILLKASEEFDFELNDKFVDSLAKYSFNNLVRSIVNCTSNQMTNSNN